MIGVRDQADGHVRSRRCVRERGTVTAELAIGLPWLVLVAAVSLWGVGAMAAKIACVDAARAGVRAASRGEPIPAVRAAVARAAPRNARVAVRRGGGTASVVVTAAVRPPLAGGLPALTIRESAEGITETGVADGSTGSAHAGDE